MRQLSPLGCSPASYITGCFIQYGRRGPDCGGAGPAGGALITFTSCLSGERKTRCECRLMMKHSVRSAFSAQSAERSSFVCSVSDGAKYCNSTSATHEAQSSQQWKHTRLYQPADQIQHDTSDIHSHTRPPEPKAAQAGTRWTNGP